MKLIRVAAVAAMLDVSRARAYELIRSGVIPGVRLGRQVRVDPAQLAKWLEEGGATVEDEPQSPVRWADRCPPSHVGTEPDQCGRTGLP